MAEGRSEWVKPTLSGSSQWPSSDRKGRKGRRLRATLPLQIQTAALNAMYVTGSILKVWVSSGARWQTG